MMFGLALLCLSRFGSLVSFPFHPLLVLGTALSKKILETNQSISLVPCAFKDRVEFGSFINGMKFSESFHFAILVFPM